MNKILVKYSSGQLKAKRASNSAFLLPQHTQKSGNYMDIPDVFNHVKIQVQATLAKCDFAQRYFICARPKIVK